MYQQVKDQRKNLLTGTRKAAEREIQEALSQLEEPALISCAGSTGSLPAAHLPGPGLALPVGVESHRKQLRGPQPSHVLEPLGCAWAPYCLNNCDSGILVSSSLPCRSDRSTPDRKDLREERFVWLTVSGGPGPQ